MPSIKTDKSAIFGRMYEAMSGDVVLSVSPSTLASSKAAVTAAIAGTGFFRTVKCAVVNAAGQVHKWFSGTLPISVAEVTAGSGVAAIVGGGSTLTFDQGEGEVVVQYTGAWDDGVAQVETITCTAGATSAGDVTMTVTAADVTGSPLDTVVALVLDDDTAAEVAGKVRTALGAVTAITTKYAVGGTGADITLTSVTNKANDATLAFGYVDTGTTGATFGSSTNTTAGVVPDTQTFTLGSTSSILGKSVSDKTSVDTITA